MQGAAKVKRLKQLLIYILLLELLDQFLVLQTLFEDAFFPPLAQNSVVILLDFSRINFYLLVLAVHASAQSRAARPCVEALAVLLHAACFGAVAPS